MRGQTRAIRTLASDRFTPLHAKIEGRDAKGLVAAFAHRSDAAILHSAPGAGGRPGRWTILAADPCLVIEATGDEWRHTDRGGKVIEEGRGEPLAVLGQLVERFAPTVDDVGVPPFRGGWIGHLGYDLATWIEAIPRRSNRDSRIPDLRFGLYEQCVTIDHLTGAIDAWGQDFGLRFDRGREHAFREYMDRIGHDAKSACSDPVRVRNEVAKPDYLRTVRSALDYIRAGDIFQVNLSQSFQARGRIDPARLFLDLCRESPAAYSALLRWGDSAIASASPECFYETLGDRIVTRPIKGTRPRGATPSEDDRLADNLRRSAKDRAELTMIVDLERNDLGRVCEYGSVKVLEPLEVETFAQVHHLVATIEGRIRPGNGPIDVVRAMFPGGSITGAPKVRAMEIIDELEPSRRGVYTGAIGYLTPRASSLNIAIRTVLVEGNRATYQVGGGIVADSDPESEYEETLHKGAALRRVLENPGAPS